MRPDTVKLIKNHPKYRELIAKRRRFSWILALLMLFLYYGFIFVIGFAPEILAAPLAEGAATTVGIPVGIAVIVSAFVLTGIYVARANSEFDDLSKEIRGSVR